MALKTNEINSECRFCEIAKGRLEHYQIWENETCVAFLDRRPTQIGHVLVIPKKHYGYVFDMPEAEYHELFEAVRIVRGPLQQFFGSVRVGVAISGFEVDHVHIHMIPINTDHELTAPRLVVASEQLQALAQTLKQLYN